MSLPSSQIVSFSIKNTFIEVEKVQNKAKRQRLKILRRIGAIYRRIMRKKLRKGPAFSKKVRNLRALAFGGDEDALARLKKLGAFKPSPAGQPPKTRKADPDNLRMILYGLEGDEVVVIGPVAFARSRGMTVPELHEEGGTIRVTNPFSTSGKTRSFTYPKRPFAWPTLNDNREVIDESIEKIGLV